MEVAQVRKRSQAAEKRGESEASKPLAAWQSGWTVLLIEDDTEMRRMLAAALRRDGHRVVEAANGDAAFDWLGAGVIEGDPTHIPDLVVSDIRLPYFTGLEILESLQVASRRIPVILITGFPDEETHAQALRLGAECLLEKPFDLAQLRAAIHLALRARPQAPRALDDVAR